MGFGFQLIELMHTDLYFAAFQSIVEELKVK